MQDQAKREGISPNNSEERGVNKYQNIADVIYVEWGSLKKSCSRVFNAIISARSKQISLDELQFKTPFAKKGSFSRD